MTNQTGGKVHRNRVGAAAAYCGGINISDVGVVTLGSYALHT